MTLTATAVRLTETHRRAQLAVRAALVADVLRLWGVFDPDDIGGSWARLEPAFLALIAAYGNVSAGLAAGYYEEFRAAEGIAGLATPRIAPLASADEVIGTLRLLGPANARRLVAAGRADAATVTFTNVAGETSRQVLNRGRNTLEGSVAADRKALGWARVTDSSPCSFCAMLASRGPVYSKKGGTFRSHGHCGCSLEPVYDRDQPWPGRAEEFRRQWNETVGSKSGAEARNTFRRAFEGN